MASPESSHVPLRFRFHSRDFVGSSKGNGKEKYVRSVYANGFDDVPVVMSGTPLEGVSLRHGSICGFTSLPFPL